MNEPKMPPFLTRVRCPDCRCALYAAYPRHKKRDITVRETPDCHELHAPEGRLTEWFMQRGWIGDTYEDHKVADWAMEDKGWAMILAQTGDDPHEKLMVASKATAPFLESFLGPLEGEE